VVAEKYRHKRKAEGMKAGIVAGQEEEKERRREKEDP